MEGRAGLTSVTKNAVTVVLLRQNLSELQVLLLKRSAHARGHPGSWVFPGGPVRVSDGDSSQSFECARAAAVRETFEECAIKVLAKGLRVLSVWVPPDGGSMRYNTVYFVSAVPSSSSPRVNGTDIKDARWVNPRVALADHSRGALNLLPPTWMTLHALSFSASIADALEACSATPRVFRTRIEQGPDEIFVGWDGIPSQRLRISSLPWSLEATPVLSSGVDYQESRSR